MSIVLGNNVLDNGLTYLQSLANRVALCSAQPTTYANVAVFQLGSAILGPGGVFTGPTNGTPNGRQVTSVAVSGGAVSQGGTAAYIAVVDDVDSVLLLTAAIDIPLSVAIGYTWQLPPFIVTIGSGASLLLKAVPLTVSTAPTLGAPALSTLSAPVVTNGSFTATEPLTTGFVIGTMTATFSPTAWSINTGNTLGYFAISNSGVITVTAAGAAGLTSAQSFSLGVQASNAVGSGLGTASVTINAASTDPWAAIDGRAAAAGGTAQFPTVLNGYVGGSLGAGRHRYPTVPTQNGSHQPEWMVAGVDYAVGPQAGTVFLDGTVQGNLPAGVTVSGGQVTVATGTSSTITVNGLDFTGLTGNNVFTINGTGTAIVQNCKFKVPSNFSTGSQFFLRCSSAATVTFQYCDVDGTGAITGPQNWPTPLFQMTGSCKQTYLYNYIHNVPFDGIYPCSSLTDNLSSCIFKYNLFAYVNYGTVAHFDCFQMFGGGNGPVGQFNTLYQPTTDQNGVALGPVNSLFRIGDLGSSTGLTVTGPEFGWNTMCGAGRILSLMQWTDSNTPAGFFVNPYMHDNFFDVGNVQNFWCYPVTSHFTGLNYINNVCLNTGGLLPSIVGNGASASWNPGFLNGGSLPSPYAAPVGVYPSA